jgi:hypothetical protein
MFLSLRDTKQSSFSLVCHSEARGICVIVSETDPSFVRMTENLSRTHPLDVLPEDIELDIDLTADSE